MKILMGTKNPGKIEGARQAFEKYFDSVTKILFYTVLLTKYDICSNYIV